MSELRPLTKFETLALAMSLGKSAALAAYARRELARHYWPSTCWKCKAELADPQAETCPACDADRVPF